MWIETETATEAERDEKRVIDEDTNESVERCGGQQSRIDKQNKNSCLHKFQFFHTNDSIWSRGCALFMAIWLFWCVYFFHYKYLFVLNLFISCDFKQRVVFFSFAHSIPLDSLGHPIYHL